MFLNSKHIICFGGYWEGLQSRRQYFMEYFAQKGIKILYIEPNYPLFYRKNRSEMKNPLFHPVLKKINKNIFVLTLTRRLPSKNFKALNYINHKLFFNQIKKVIDSLDLINYHIWIYNLYFVKLLKYFDYNNLIFDMIDDFMDVKYGGNKFRDDIYYLFNNSDLVIFTNNVLRKKYCKFTNKCSVISNGFDSKLFNYRKISNKTIPEDIKGIKKPIVGFIGSLFHFIDFEIIEYVIKNNPKINFVFIGSWENLDYIRTRLEKYQNYHYLGRKNFSEIPLYLKYFDLCLNPFITDNIGNAVSPLKLYEYLAMGKKIISTKITSIIESDISEFIYFASDKYEFNDLIKKILDQKISLNKPNPKIIARYNWNNLAFQAYEAIKTL